MKSSTGLALHFMRKGLPRRSWACPAALRGVLDGEGASATTAPKCTKVLGGGNTDVLTESDFKLFDADHTSQDAL